MENEYRDVLSDLQVKLPQGRSTRIAEVLTDRRASDLRARRNRKRQQAKRARYGGR